jgi:ubiquinone/menaquinone biosynthesis C-methylase UbiE
METVADVRAHYARSDLLDAIQSGLETLGKSVESLTTDDLASVDEFHIGGREASEDFFGQLELGKGMHLLDIGCGIGGPARFAASRYGCKVTGVDLTPEYVETGQALCRWMRLQDKVLLHCENALSLPFENGAFDGAYMMHVGMNIPDKNGLCLEIGRVLRSGARFGVYDVMRLTDEELTYPVPWATTSNTSALASPDEYRAALEAAGFEVIHERSRHEFALAFFARLLAKATAAGPSPLGLHLVMGKSAPEKVRNMIENVSAGRIAPVELIARKSQ